MSANSLKLVALIAMTIDHIGYFIFPECLWMRIVGRVSFPVFAYMIAEGCRYTSCRSKYLLKMALIGVCMQIVMFIATQSLYQSVFISFTLAIIFIYLIDNALIRKQVRAWMCVVLYGVLVMFLCIGLPHMLCETDYHIDYGMVGVLIPVVCYYAKSRRNRLVVYAVSLIVLSLTYGDIQWFCLLSVLLMLAYNGKRGKCRLKNLFYIYYPIHLGVIFIIDMIINSF